jgi:transposase-like protein
MPKTHCAAPELASLLDGRTAGELIPELARHGLQQLIELEVAAVIGADRHESTDEWHGYRNGYRHRSLTTQVGDIDLLKPNCVLAASCPRSLSHVAGWTRSSAP